MQSKKIKTIIVTALTGCMLLTFTAVASASGASGYQTFKTAAKDLAVTNNATIQTTFELKDNGNTAISGTSIQKLEGTNDYSSTKIITGDTTQESESSSINGQTISRDGENYYSRTNKDNQRKEKKLDATSSKMKLGEMVLDTLVGDVKNQFVVDGDTISVKLEGAQIPELAKLAISAAAEENSNVKNDKENFKDNEVGNDGLKEALKSLPSLTNLDVKSLSLTAKLNGSNLTDNNFKIVITGDDASGVSHEFELSADTIISDVNSTKVTAIDTTGKDVKEVQNKGYNKKD